MGTLHITIDDVDYATTDDDQEAAALLRMADRDPQRYDLFLIDANGVEMHIDDTQIVDLHDGEPFRARRKVRFSINGKPYSSYDDDQTAASLMRLAGVDPATHDLTRGGGGPAETFADQQLVTVGDGDDFTTVPQSWLFTIIVNTRPHQWRDRQISYAQVVELARPGQPIGEQDDVTVRYTYSHGHGGGTLTAGHGVDVKEGMVFDVHRTTRS